MRNLCFIEPGKVEWREALEPKINNAREAIVRPIVIGRCDLDLGFILGIAPIAQGEPLGHEIIGEVVDLGDAVTSVKIGDRVVVPGQISCGECRNCRRGYTGRCQSVPFSASYGMGRKGNFGGGAADLVHVPYADAMLFPLPEGAIASEWIGFADMAQDGYRAVGPALLERPGARVLVIGGLPPVIGIYAAGIAVAMGAGEVDYYDADPQRLAEAKRYGANPIDSTRDEPKGLYEIVVDSSIEDKALAQAFQFAEPEAMVTSVSIHFGDKAKAPLTQAYHKGVFYRTGRPNCRQYMAPLADLCCQNKFKPQLISAKGFAFDDAPEAWLDPALRTYASRE